MFLTSTVPPQFSNGGLDPWSAGSVLEDLSDTVVAVQTPGISHTYDLWPARREDSKEVQQSRDQILEYIQDMLGAASRRRRLSRRLLGRA